ncbi:MAG: hypothetical protein JXX14_06000 [Deltaproteobacteria bacterium]|nr:hypothetical protein [Deltaproteobacteria bacterium]
MNWLKFAILGLLLLLCTGCLQDIVDNLDNPDEACFQKSLDVQSCHSFNSVLGNCRSDEPPADASYQYLPGCDIVEHCTGDAADTADTDSSTTSQDGACTKVCEGELTDCGELSKSQCVKAYHCEWYDGATM